MKELERLQKPTSGVSTRVRLAILDVLELRKGNWVPRREVNTVKKIEDVRAQVRAGGGQGQGSG